MFMTHVQPHEMRLEEEEEEGWGVAGGPFFWDIRSPLSYHESEVGARITALLLWCIIRHLKAPDCGPNRNRLRETGR